MADSSEAAALVETLWSWAQAAITSMEANGKHFGSDDECSACPLCRLVQYVRSHDAAVTTQFSTALADTAIGVAELVRLTLGANAGVDTQQAGQARQGGHRDADSGD